MPEAEIFPGTGAPGGCEPPEDVPGTKLRSSGTLTLSSLRILLGFLPTFLVLSDPAHNIGLYSMWGKRPLLSPCHLTNKIMRTLGCQGSHMGPSVAQGIRTSVSGRTDQPLLKTRYSIRAKVTDPVASNTDHRFKATRNFIPGSGSLVTQRLSHL